MKQLPVILLLILAVGTSTSIYAQEFPDPPAGFSWQEAPDVNGAFLVPEGWSFRTEKDKGTIAYFITAQAFAPPAKYETGVNINAFLDSPNASNQVESIIRAYAERYSTELTHGSFGPFLTLQCEVELEATKDHDVIRLFYMAISNSRTGSAYLVMFESSEARWNEMWPKGEKIVTMLALDGDT